MQADEQQLWSGKPSQWQNLDVFVTAGLFCWLIFPLFLLWHHWLTTRATEYRVTSQRLIMTTGVFSTQTNFHELYNFKSCRFSQPWYLIRLNLVDVEILTNTDSVILLRAVQSCVPEILRDNIELCRRRYIREQGVVNLFRQQM